jgi:hypothetical protein
MAEYPELIPENNLIDFVTNDGGNTYNMCHFWSNFEIADLNWLRGPAYLRYFEYLDRAGGFFYERWGDAPVHSIAAAIFLNKTEVHFFDDIGYRHNPFTHCPTRRELQKKCHCNADDNFGKQPSTLIPRKVQQQTYLLTTLAIRLQRLLLYATMGGSYEGLKYTYHIFSFVIYHCSMFTTTKNESTHTIGH